MLQNQHTHYHPRVGHWIKECLNYRYNLFPANNVLNASNTADVIGHYSSSKSPDVFLDSHMSDSLHPYSVALQPGDNEKRAKHIRI